MRKLLIIMSILLVLFMLNVCADVTEEKDIIESESGDFSVEVLPVENKILRGGKAVLQIRITNNENITRKYRIGFDNTGEWLSIRTDPTYHALSGIDIEDSSSDTTTVNLKARPETDYGTYFVKTTITNEDTEESVVVLLPVGIKTEEELAGVRLPDLRVSLDVPQKVDPREENTIILYLLNKNNRDIPELSIELESKLLGKKELQESLDPNEEKEVRITFKLDPLTEPQEDTVKGKVTVAGYTFTPTAKTFEVTSYNTQLEVKQSVGRGFFKSVKTIGIGNQGNVPVQDTIKSEYSLIKSLFTKTEPEARVVEVGGLKYYSWVVNADPEVSSEITITTNYQPLLWIILVIIALLVVKYGIRSQVKIIKKSTSAEMKEGGLSNIKILLTIRNEGVRPIKDVEVKDTVPHIADIKKEFPIGTLHPDKILMHKTKGTIAKWKIDELDASEERIIKYEIKSKLSIVGSLTLPAATVKYKTARGRERKVTSNKLIVG